MTQLAITEIAAPDVATLAAGAGILGAGGGGDVAVAEAILYRLLAERADPVVVCRPDDLPVDALIVHAAVYGAPAVLGEQLIDLAGVTCAVRAVAERVSSNRVQAVGVIEIGGINALVAAMVAADLKVPLIDGDLMGRAYPRIGQTSMAFAGEPLAPMAMVSNSGDVVVIVEGSTRALESLAVTCTDALGGLTALAMYPTTAGVLARVGVAGSVSECMRIGARYLATRHRDPAEIARALGAGSGYVGRVDELRSREGRSTGYVTLREEKTGSVVRVDHQEEFHGISVNGFVVASTPEIIAAFDLRTRKFVRIDQLRVGQRLLLCALPALYSWPSAALGLVGPTAFGLDYGLVP